MRLNHTELNQQLKVHLKKLFLPACKKLKKKRIKEASSQTGEYLDGSEQAEKRLEQTKRENDNPDGIQQNR